MAQTLVSIRDLSVRYRSRDEAAYALDQVSFDIERGSVFALVGESGSGKTTIGMSVLNLLPDEADILGGEVYFGPDNMLTLDERSLRDIRNSHDSHAEAVDGRLDKVEQQIVRIDELDRHKVLDRVGALETKMAAAVKSGDLDRLHDRISGVRQEYSGLHGEISGMAGEVKAMHQSLTTIVQHLLDRPEGARK